jgi:hypothetical protein
LWLVEVKCLVSDGGWFIAVVAAQLRADEAMKHRKTTQLSLRWFVRLQEAFYGVVRLAVNVIPTQ